jgi:hypothetical protein
MLQTELYFKKIDLNNDNKISFEEYDIFVRMVYETEYIPSLEREFKRRNLSRPSSLFIDFDHNAGRRRSTYR